MLANRVTEKDLRDWLESQGYVGKFAQVVELELHAIERPGWVQVFRFRIRVRRQTPDPELTVDGPDQERPWLDRWGVVVDDERRRRDKTQVWMFDNVEDCRQKLDTEAEDRIVLRRGQTHTGIPAWLAILTGLFLLAALLSLLKIV